ncbi:MAG: Crp/Fnr family transcriptional regulator [Actinomycetota bacterium]|nr:cyclic nucleotide-binding domain-containing protein [Actinomycetota bacterium]
MAKPTIGERTEVLATMPLFAGLSQRSLQRILKVANEFEAPAGQIMVQPGMPGSGMFVIEEGTVVARTSRREIEIGPGECFGELALLTDRVRTARVQAKTAVTCLAISRSDFIKLLETEPKIAVHLLEILAGRLADAN